MKKPLLVFCCYARDDQSYLYQLKNHLMALQREALIEIKADIDITPGKEWKREINHHLESAQIILLLISSDFIASDYCYETEMQQALARHKQGTACVIPVIIRPSAWQGTPFSKLQALPKNAKPVSSWANVDEAYTSIVEGIRAVIQEFIGNSTHQTLRRTSPLPAEDHVKKFTKGSTEAFPSYHAPSDNKNTPFSRSTIRSAYPSPDGKRIAAFASSTMYIWDITTGSTLITVQNAGWGSAVAWSPDGKYIATHEPPDLDIWDTATGQCLLKDHQVRRHDDRMPGIAWSPNGRYFAMIRSHRWAYNSESGDVAISKIEMGLSREIHQIDPYA